MTELLPAGAILLIFSVAFRRIMKRFHGEVLKADRRLRIFLQESLPIVHTYSVEQAIEQEADRKMGDHRQIRMKRSAFSVSCSLGFGFLMNLVYLLGAFYCGWGILSCTMNYRTFMALLQLVG